MTSYRLRSGLTIRGLPEGDAVVADADGMDAVIVNATAHAVLELLTAERSRDDLVAEFRQAFPDQDPSTLARDIDALIAHLIGVGFVEPCGAASSTA
jgi:hypothetical protein